MAVDPFDHGKMNATRRVEGEDQGEQGEQGSHRRVEGVRQQQRAEVRTGEECQGRKGRKCGWYSVMRLLRHEPGRQGSQGLRGRIIQAGRREHEKNL
eukprot:767934-Hanusia_phi.AAC.5